MDAEPSNARFCVEVAFATPECQRLIVVEVTAATTAREAVARANLPAHFPDQPDNAFTEAPLGIFGKVLREPERQRLSPGDRIEVYRPLQVDPRTARRARAARQVGR